MNAPLKNTPPTPAVSVIVPVYNTCEYLPECLDSLGRQDVDLEVVVVDDGSTDGSREVIERYRDRDSRIRAFFQENRGPAAARNRGLDAARGSHIAFLDSDDWLEAGSLGSLYRRSLETEADMVMGKTWYYYSPERIELRYKLPPAMAGSVVSGKTAFPELMRAGGYVPMIYNYLYRREWLEKLGQRFEDLSLEDELWTLTALVRAERLALMDFPFYYYRQREGSLMKGGIPRDREVRSLFRIVERLVRFSGRYAAAPEDVRLRGWIYVKMHELYYYAFRGLAYAEEEIDVDVPASLLSALRREYDRMPQGEAKALCRYYRLRMQQILKKMEG